MNPDVYLEIVHKKLRRNNFEIKENRMCETDVTIATKKEFTLIHLKSINFLVIVGISDNITPDSIKDFSRISLDLASRNKRGMLSKLGSCTFLMIVLVSQNVDREAKQWVQQMPRQHFNIHEIPIIVDLKNDEIYHYEEIPPSQTLIRHLAGPRR